MTAAFPLLLAAIAGLAHSPTSLRIYSDFCTEGQSGDVSGHRIDLRGSLDHPHATFFWSEGAIMMPREATPIFTSGGKIKFAVRGPEGKARFTGILRRDYLEGRVRDFGQQEWTRVLLQRRYEEPQLPPPCAGALESP